MSAGFIFAVVRTLNSLVKAIRRNTTQMAQQKHFMFFAFPAYGHIIPLLELAKRASERHKVTFVLTKSYMDGFRKRNLLLSPYDAKIHLVELEDEIPEDRDKVYPTPGMRRVVYFAKYMEKPICDLLENFGAGEGEPKTLNSKPDVVITDKSLTNFLAPLCQKLEILCYLFNPDPGFDIAATLNVDESIPSVEQIAQSLEETTIASPRPVVTPGVPLVSDDYKDYLVDVNRHFDLADGIAINNFREADPDAFAKIETHQRLKKNGKNFKVFCVGPLFCPETMQPEGDTVTPHITAWLNSRKPRSMLYISFGTIVSLPENQLAEIAKAICDESASFSVLWSVPEKLHSYVPKELMEKSQAYLAGPQDKDFPRVLVLPWTPQKYVLCHPSTRLYLTHAGWNSTLESVTAGIPMVAYPLCSDQHANAAWICKNGLGFCIPDTSMGKNARIVPAEEITKAVHHAGDWDKNGRNLYAEQVEKWAERIRTAIDKDGSSWNDIESLLGSA